MKRLSIGNRDANVVLQRKIRAEAWRARFLPGAREIAVGDTEGNLYVFDLERNKWELYNIPCDHIVAIECIASPNRLLIGTLLQGVYLVNRPMSTISRLNHLSIQVVHDVSIAPLRNLIAVVGSHITVGCLPLEGEETERKIVPPPLPNPSSVAFSPDSTLMIVGAGEGTDEKAYLCVYETTNFDLLKTMSFAEALGIDRLIFNSKGYLLAAGGYQQCFLIEAGSRFALCTSFSMSSWVTALRFSEDGGWLFIGDDSGKVCVCSLETKMVYRGEIEGTVLDGAFGVDGCLYIAYSKSENLTDSKNHLMVERVRLPS